MTKDAMDGIANKLGREGIYGLMGKACAALDKRVFLRYCMEAFGNRELEGMAQRMLIDAVAEANVLIELLCETCMTMSERHELACAEEYKCKKLVDEAIGGEKAQ